MNKVVKLFAIMFLALVVISTATPMVFAETAETTPDSLLTTVKPNITSAANASTDFVNMVNKILGLIQVASVFAAVLLVAIFGFKFILGSASEKAEYQKSFIPLIVGVIVVFSATSIAKLLIGLIK